MDWRLEDRIRKGRGAISNRSGRFETAERYLIDDGWVTEKNEPEHIATTLSVDTARTVITRNNSPDVPFDRSINPYRGCEHGCIYCFARPTHAYYGLSPGLDFETRLFYKPDAAERLRIELDEQNYAVDVMALGTNTDPYQPIERQIKLTRRIIEVLAEYNHPFGIVTKSDLVLRDTDIIGPMAAKGMATVTVSVTTLDRALAHKLEPRAPTPQKRLAAIVSLASLRIRTGVLVAPIIPALNDIEMEKIVGEAAKAGAVRAGYVLLRLPLETSDLFSEWLKVHFPDKASHVLNLVRDTHLGKIYDSNWNQRMVGSGPYADMLSQRFKRVLRKYGLDKQSADLDLSRFRRPPHAGVQLDLL
ncbi:MAG: PA0069 family radical SAM protein [Pseudomonadota bacterium]|nr:PA0069 family radical SAM protein [Pseudomonadota bacterium]